MYQLIVVQETQTNLASRQSFTSKGKGGSKWRLKDFKMHSAYKALFNEHLLVVMGHSFNAFTGCLPIKILTLIRFRANNLRQCMLMSLIHTVKHTVEKSQSQNL